jgi:hypothetical protein
MWPSSPYTTKKYSTRKRLITINRGHSEFRKDFSQVEAAPKLWCQSDNGTCPTQSAFILYSRSGQLKPQGADSLPRNPSPPHRDRRAASPNLFNSVKQRSSADVNSHRNEMLKILSLLPLYFTHCSEAIPFTVARFQK